MRRTLASAAAALVLLMAAPEIATASGRGPCSQDRFDTRPRMGHEVIERKVRGLIRCAVGRWSVPGGVATADRIARCESGYYPWAVGGNNLGVYQHAAPYWMARVHRYLRPAWFNDHQWHRLTTRLNGAFIARANVLVAMRMAHAGGWAAWSCY